MEFIDSMMIVDDEDVLNKGFARVLGFNKTARGKYHFSQKDIDFQKGLVLEEFKELKEAIDNKDRKEVIDALCDLFVVGTYWHFITKMKYHLLGVSEEEQHKVDHGFLPTMYEVVVDDCTREVEDFLGSGRFYGEMPTYLVTRLGESINLDLTHTAVTIIGELLRCLDFDHERALFSVLGSNDSKLPKYADLVKALEDVFGHMIDLEAATKEQVLKLQADLLNNQHAGRYEGITGTILDGRAVFKDSNSKIMKPCTFFEPDLAGL